MSVQSVDRAIHLLSEVGAQPAGLVTLADRVGLPLTTTSRILGTLEEQTAVRRDVDGTYFLGPWVRGLAAKLSPTPSIRDIALPVLIELSGTLDEATCISVPVGHETLTLAQYDTDRAVQAQNWEGRRWPITGGGSGAVMMSTWPAERVRLLLDPLSSAERKTVHALVESARKTGLSWSQDSYVEGLSSLAAPVLGADGSAVAAVIGYGPSYRFPKRSAKKTLERAVAAAAQKITDALGEAV